MKEKRAWMAMALSAVLLVGCRPQTAQDTATDLVITNGMLIDGTGAPPLAEGVVVVRGDRIAAVGAVGEVDIAADADIVDAQGGTILPGIIDSHVHSTWDASVRRRFLLAGVTAVCDLGSPLARIEEFSIDSTHQGPAARGFSAGPIVTAPEGLPDAVLREDLNFEVGSPEAARAGVEDLARRGAEMIKVYLHRTNDGRIYPMLDVARLAAITAAARDLGLPIRAHVSRLAVVGVALDGGVDVIDHLPKALIDSSEFEEALGDSADPLADLHDLVVVPEYDALFLRMVEDDVVMVPTLDAGLGRFYQNPDAGPGERVVGEAIVEVVSNFLAAGGILALGTDYNANSGLEPAMPLREMSLFAAAGLTTLEVIETATRHAARVCGQGSELGTLEPGKLADLIVVDGDPLADLSILADVMTVVKDGELVEVTR